ncbi:MAG TPA: hypothetical protein DCM86_04355 [Verrucomicrobiales bacterium]|nr:hypothetical protein [Verrucomicrobiales bacterium]
MSQVDAAVFSAASSPNSVMESGSQNEFGQWVGTLARRAAAFLCIARMHDLQAEKARRNLQRAASACAGEGVGLPAELRPPASKAASGLGGGVGASS